MLVFNLDIPEDLQAELYEIASLTRGQKAYPNALENVVHKKSEPHLT